MTLLQKDLFNSPYSGVFCVTNDLLTLVPPGIPDDDMAAIQNVLSPSVAEAFGKIVPELAPVFEQYRTEEPNLVMPISVAANYAMKQYGVQDPKQAVAVLTEDIFGGMQPTMETQQTNVPPGNEPQGLMTSPQNMETV